MFWRIVNAERMKLKSNWVLFSVVMAPLFVLLIQFANFMFRYQSVVKKGDIPWVKFIEQHAVIWAVMILPILAAVLSSILIGVENTDNNWKYILSLPFKRGYIYLAKLSIIFYLLVVSSILLGLGMIVSASLLNLPGQVPIVFLIKTLLGALIGVFAILNIQFWLSTKFENPGIPLAIAICGTVTALFLLQSTFTRWLPWVYPYLTLPIKLNEGINIIWYVCQSVILGFLCFGAGLRQFVNKDV
ncbi:ABC transporter permease [Priestia megaterium]